MLAQYMLSSCVSLSIHQSGSLAQAGIVIAEFLVCDNLYVNTREAHLLYSSDAMFCC